MKILYFFNIFDGKLKRLYKKIKGREITGFISYLRKTYAEQEVEFLSYCLNQDLNYLRSNGFNPTINSVLNEYLNIDIEIHKKLVDSIWAKIKDLFHKIVSTDFKQLNYFWKILEFYIKRDITNFLEQVEFIISIIEREKPDLVIISEFNPFLFKIFRNKNDELKVKILFSRSKIDKIFYNLNKFVKFCMELLSRMSNIVIYKMKGMQKKAQKSKERERFIGFSYPRDYFFSAVEPVYEELRRHKINVVKYGPIFFNFKTTFEDFKYLYSNWIRLNRIFKKYWRRDKFKQRITQNLPSDFKEIIYHILESTFFEFLIRSIYWHKNLEREIKNRDFKVMVILTEYYPEGRTVFYTFNKYKIPIYFIPHAGIPQRGEDITPYLISC